VKSGYVPAHPFLDRGVNFCGALVLLILSAPLFAIICLGLLATQEPIIFYRGQRLGQNGRPFFILKFRTLKTSAEKMTSDRTLPRRSRLETRLGKFLRDCRLDELPQLMNVLRGDMNLLGPRPVRAEIAAKYGAEIPHYGDRFRVKPGLIGYTQVYMSHGAAKRIRARYNRMLCRAPINYARQIAFVARVGAAVLGKAVALCLHKLFRISRKDQSVSWLGQGFAQPRNCVIAVSGGGDQLGSVSAISDELLQFVSLHPLHPGAYGCVVTRELSKGRKVSVNLDVDVHVTQPVGMGYAGYVHYGTFRMPTEMASYLIDRYFLKAPVLSC
jgi:lipopolysaccharide/colanic/teichoic acid biosynthesis glycosyltransferase